MIIPPQFLALGGAVALIAGFAGGWTVRDWKASSDALKAATAAEAERARLQTQVETQATSLEQERAHVIDRTSEIRTIYRDKVVPAVCEPEPAAISLLDAARADASSRATGGTGDTLPRD